MRCFYTQWRLGILLAISIALNGCGKSGAVDQTFIPINSTTDKVLLYEILYNPTGTESQGEWIELYNPGTTSISLNGWYIQNKGGNDALLSGTIPANSYFVIANNASGFLTRYGKNATISATFSLSNDADHIYLFNDSRELVDTVAWGGDIAGWTSIASDGQSFKRHSFLDGDTANDWGETSDPLPDN